ncbi:hypothetical protein BRADI_4g40345v3 [Brachypodium distachyon]|uniref:Myb/SANT-like domain-containing protein n=1 Tax=Brachypodium distachyon TaxID=15368 RepID=A0A2K2CTG9_BRADI|nr:hypothetical protein BRADI_4g40345v3 [Brachypodium distachyon]
MPEAEWNDEHTRVICELFAEQVQAGNRPNTHLKNIGYSVVADKFEQRTGLLYTKLQLKNKWDKLKSDYINWKKLLIKGANLGWDNERRTIAADSDWWKNTFKDLPGAKKFRKAGLRNENYLKVIFEDITSVDQSSAAADHDGGVLLDQDGGAQPVHNGGVLLDHDGGAQPVHNGAVQLDHNGITQLEHEPPSIRNKKRTIHVNTKENKKNKTETALLMQAQLKRIVELAAEAQSIFEKFSSQIDSPRSDIQDVMTLVRECGARSGSDEYFIATELFVNAEQRQMFCTMETAEERLEWLRRKYNAKYRA